MTRFVFPYDGSNNCDLTYYVTCDSENRGMTEAQTFDRLGFLIARMWSYSHSVTFSSC